MGTFLAISAFKTVDVDKIAKGTIDYLFKFEVEAKTSLYDSDSSIDDECDAVIYSPQNGWTVVQWPKDFLESDFPLTKAVSEENKICASSIHVYDGEYWEHLFVNKGEKLHFFSSSPNSWTDELNQNPSFIIDPTQMCSLLGIEPNIVQPYIIDSSELDSEIKATKDDEFDLNDFWVFTDFWDKLGIQYPDENSPIKVILKLDKDFYKKLPF